MTWRHLLLPLNPLYRGAVTARSTAYERGWIRRRHLAAPVISIGNIGFGGTGKTPTVIALVRDLVRVGRKPAVLTRGYRRRTRSLEVVVGPRPRFGVHEVGDEPLEIASRLPGVPVVVHADRFSAGSEALRIGADILVLDDGFQHLRLRRDLDLVLLDAGDPWSGGRLPPRGRLREPLTALHRADAILVTKVPSRWQSIVTAVADRLEGLAPGVPVFAARFRATRVAVPDEGWREPEILSGLRVTAFAGLGRPGGFETLLAEAGAEVVGRHWFPDHHEYSARDLDALVQQAEDSATELVTTAKDAVKLPAGTPVWVVEAAMEPVEGSWDGLWRLLPGVGP